MSRKHHYLPQFYLKGFVGEGEKMYYCKKKYDTYRGISTAGIYYANDLNNVDFGQYGIYDLENKLRVVINVLTDVKRQKRINKLQY